MLGTETLGAKEVADEVIDYLVFDQLLKLGDGDPEFVRTVITEYCEQAERTIMDMQEAM